MNVHVDSRSKLNRKKERICMALLAAALLTGCLWIFRGFLFGNAISVFRDTGGDTLDLYVPQFCTLVNHLERGELTFWDFSYGMGTNLFMLNLFDPFTLIVVFLGLSLGTAHMLIYLAVLQAIRVLAAGILFYLFLSEFPLRPQTRLWVSLCYAFSGYLLVWGQHYMFGTAIVYLPLCLLFAEKSLQRKKAGLFLPVAVFLQVIYSVYFSYMTLTAVGVYALVRVLMMPELTLKQRCLLFLRVVGEMILGIFLGMGVFLPTTYVITGVSSRLSEGAYNWKELLRACFSLHPAEYYQVLGKRFFSTNLGNVSELGYAAGYHGFINYYEDPILFCSVLTVILDLQFLFSFWRSGRSFREKLTAYLLAGFLAILLCLQLGSIVLNGFTSSAFRFTYLLLVPMLLAAAWMWDAVGHGMRLSTAALAVAAAAMGWAFREGIRDSTFSEYRMNIRIVAGTSVLMILLLLLIWLMNLYNRQMVPKKWLEGLMILLLFIQLLSEGSITFVDRITLRKTDDPPESRISESVLEKVGEKADSFAELSARMSLAVPQNYFREMYREDIQDALAWLDRYEDGFYRVEKDFSSGTLSMDALIQDYHGISTYNSVMNGNLRRFLKACYPDLRGSDPNHMIYGLKADDHQMADFLGVKYVLSKTRPADTSAYRLIATIGGIRIYKSTGNAEICRFYKDAWSEDSLLALPASSRAQRRFLDQAVALEEAPDLEEKMKKEDPPQAWISLDPLARDDLVTGHVLVPEDGYLLFMIPYERGWTLQVDGEEKPLLKADLAFLGCEIPEGGHDIRLSFDAPGLKTGSYLALGAWIFWIGLVIADSVMRKKHSSKNHQIF